MKSLLKICAFLLGSVVCFLQQAWGAPADEFLCTLSVRNLSGQLVSESTLNAAAVRKPSLDLPPTTQAGLSLSSNTPNGGYIQVSLNYRHAMGSGARRAWQHTCFAPAICDGSSPNACSGSQCATPSSNPEDDSSGWTPVPIFENGGQAVPAFNQSTPLRGDYRGQTFLASWSCSLTNTIP